jgi:hypothetical protein
VKTNTINASPTNENEQRAKNINGSHRVIKTSFADEIKSFPT